ncbi:SDR family oxidoreductase [Paenibacillus radicis (ex Xue et al. 2023)]|uniref:NAD-dependent epimerase/dehydratase family protein n=1 Tax=Paenibacillus radicis (ex Xue et al. 2023) TaxID=2972489 RepID=A0ABT1YGU4_9BACL|nr:NAD(P)H-binding protein [Paenibacillus radicis (ex Xue et al. 2023)]MCR8632417.1 NAD-dependent epimerase/dehydratase family protein [Paenibacillus radicis (ex Xue et al. 2023)]
MLLITGATGFTGSHLIKKLVQKDVEIRCFVRETSDIKSLDLNRVEVAYGSFEDTETYRKALEGVHTLINIASLGFGHAPIIVGEAQRAGVRRAVFVSTTALFTTLEAKTKVVRIAAENTVKGSNLNYTIIRPTMIYGTERDRNMCRLIKTLNKYPMIPIAGNGNSLQQPIHVDDLADAILKAVNTEEAIRKAYNVSGKQPITYNQVIEETLEALNKKAVRLHIPVKAVLPLIKFYSKLSKNPKIKAEQILRLNENKAFDHFEAKRDFGFSPRSFSEGISQEVKRMKDLGII